MLDALMERFRQGHRTILFPKEDPAMPERYRGRPVLDSKECPSECSICEGSCPVDAIKVRPAGSQSSEPCAASAGSHSTEPLAASAGSHSAERRPEIDLGACLFCPECSSACPSKVIGFSRDFRLAARKREDLIARHAGASAQGAPAAALPADLRNLLGRALRLREVSAGGCNACEADTNVLSTVGFDLSRFGIQFVASPRHADGIYVTGPVTENMRVALLKTWEAVPAPKIVIACGACAISGGPFAGSDEIHDGVSKFLPVDLFIPGCPPHPMTILDGLLRMLG